MIAIKSGYLCFHIFDWDDIDKCIQHLKPKTSLYARNLELKEIDKTSASLFEEKFHLQGKLRGQKVCLELFNNDELVELMTFGKPRYNKNYQWELLRLCTNSDYRVVGGASKLFKYFLKSYHPISIISYCDLAKFSGKIYKTLGFKHLRTNEPSRHWSKYDQHISDSYLIQHGYDRIFGTNYGVGSSNIELMRNSGWRSVYDCGQSVYIWKS